MFIFIAFILLALNSTYAATSGSSWKIYVENDADMIGGPGSDNNYSNGIKFSYLYAEDRIPFWSPLYRKIFRVLNYDDQLAVVNYGLSLGHQIYTPEDIQTFELITDDRAYAAWLTLGLSSAIKYKERLHLWDISLGLVGPSARGEEVQTNFHHLVNSEIPRGWNNQLKDELTFQMFYQQRLKWWEFTHDGIRFLDVIPFWGAALGNVQVDAHAGLMLRLGFRLSDDFGPARPSASEVDGMVNPLEVKDKKLGGYAFTSIKGSAIERNLFLDGNTFKNSHSVDKIPFTNEWEGGLGVRYYGVLLIWSYVTRSPEFKERRKSHSFSSISLQYISEY